MSRYREPQPGEMLKYLPAMYQEGEGPDRAFLGNFLAAFEKILVGRDDAHSIPASAELLQHYHGSSVPLTSLETEVATIADLFDPQATWDEFLPWLASWAAFSLRADLPVASQRNFLEQIIQLYRRRGTKDNLTKLLTLFTIGEPTVTEVETTPYHFRVKLVLTATVDAREIDRQVAIAYALIDLEKPAYTTYELNAEHVSMQIGDPVTKAGRSTIGKDTMLGVRR